MSLKCKICGEETDTCDEMIEHAHDTHSDVLDEALQEYVSDVEREFLEGHTESDEGE